MTESVPLYFQKHFRENFNADDYSDYVGDGCIYYGQSGCGKTTKLIKLAAKAISPIILSFANKGLCNNYQEGGP